MQHTHIRPQSEDSTAATLSIGLLFCLGCFPERGIIGAFLIRYAAPVQCQAEEALTVDL